MLFSYEHSRLCSPLGKKKSIFDARNSKIWYMPNLCIFLHYFYNRNVELLVVVLDFQ